MVVCSPVGTATYSSALLDAMVAVSSGWLVDSSVISSPVGAIAVFSSTSDAVIDLSTDSSEPVAVISWLLSLDKALSKSFSSTFFSSLALSCDSSEIFLSNLLFSSTFSIESLSTFTSFISFNSLSSLVSLFSLTSFTSDCFLAASS